MHAALYAVAAANFTEKRVEKAYTKHRVQIWFNSKTHGGCIALAHCTDSTEFIKTFECGGSLYCTLRRFTCKFYSKTCGESMLPLPKTHSTDFTVKTVKGLALHLHTAQILVDILYAGKHMDGACIAHCADTHATLCTVTHVEVACTPHCEVKHVQPVYCMHCTECQFCSKTCVGSIALSQRTECRFYSKTGSCRADHVVTWRVNEHCALNRFSWKFSSKNLDREHALCTDSHGNSTIQQTTGRVHAHCTLCRFSCKFSSKIKCRGHAHCTDSHANLQ